MKNLLWLLGGVLFVSVAFFLPGGAEHIWQSLLFSGVAVLSFLLALMFSRNKQSSPNRNLAGTTCVILLLIFGIYGWLGYQKAQNQDKLLVETRTTIESGIAKSKINAILLETLRGYYSGNNQQADMGAHFRQYHDSLITDGRINFPSNENNEPPYFELVKASEDSVVIVAYSSFAQGKKAEFKNYDGQRGNLQAKGILTAKGIAYEREN